MQCGNNLQGYQGFDLTDASLIYYYGNLQSPWRTLPGWHHAMEYPWEFLLRFATRSTCCFHYSQHPPNLPRHRPYRRGLCQEIFVLFCPSPVLEAYLVKVSFSVFYGFLYFATSSEITSFTPYWLYLHWFGTRKD
jgi:hypothetical protein